MRQLTYVKPNVLEWRDVPAPRIQSDSDVIVRPLAVTRCDLDLYIANGVARFEGPFAIGHEASGVVEEIGDKVSSVRPGDLVIVPMQISCGACDRCRRGLTNACTAVPFRSSYGLKPLCGVEYGGSLSDLIRVPFADHMLVKHPKRHSLISTAAMADSATDAFSVVAPALRVRPGADIMVVGGRGQGLALLIVHAALSLGSSRVLYVDTARDRLEKAKALGAELRELSSYDDAPAIGQFPLVVDADGTVASLKFAIRNVEPGGTCHRTYGDFVPETLVPLQYMYGMCINLSIGRVQARAHLPDCVAHLERGHFHPEEVLTRRVRFEDAHEAILDPTIKVAFIREGVE